MAISAIDAARCRWAGMTACLKATVKGFGTLLGNGANRSCWLGARRSGGVVVSELAQRHHSEYGLQPRSAMWTWRCRGTATPPSPRSCYPRGRGGSAAWMRWIISLYAGGMTLPGIQHHLASTIATEPSQETISKIADQG